MTEDEQLVTCDIDFSLGEYIRRTVFNFAKHRRIEYYGSITEQTGVVVSPNGERRDCAFDCFTGVPRTPNPAWSTRRSFLHPRPRRGTCDTSERR